MKLKNLEYAYLVLFLLLVAAFYANHSHAKQARNLRIGDGRIERVNLTYGRTTVLNFLSKPTKVLLGSHGLFAVEYVESDVAIAPLLHNARSNIFVYLGDKRYAFDLSTVNSGGDEIVIIRDASGKKVPVEIR